MIEDSYARFLGCDMSSECSINEDYIIFKGKMETGT